NAVHDRLLQSMCVRFSDSEQWSSPVKPPRSQNYVKPQDARTRVHVAKVRRINWRADSAALPAREKPSSRRRSHTPCRGMDWVGKIRRGLAHRPNIPLTT